MKNLSKPIIVLLVSILPSLVLHAQINPVYKIMKQRGWISPIENNLEKLTPDQVAREMISAMSYNDTTLLLLKKDSVNLLELYKHKIPWNDKIFAALSDCIVIGTVSKIVHPGIAPYYYTLAYVKVKKYLRNDYNLPKNLIEVLIASGPTGKGEVMMQNGEETLSVDENVLLFLSAGGLIQMASYSNMHELYSKLINDSRIRFRIIAKYDLEDNKAIGKQRVRNLANVKSEIEKVVTIINRKRL